MWNLKPLIKIQDPEFSLNKNQKYTVCLCFCVSVSPANILIFYFSATRRDIDLKLIQNTYRVVPDSLKRIDLHRSKVKVTGRVHCFLKVQSYHKNWAIENFQYSFINTSLYTLSTETIKTWASQKIRQYLMCNM